MAQLKALRVTEEVHTMAKEAKKLMAVYSKGEVTSINGTLRELLTNFINKMEKKNANNSNT